METDRPRVSRVDVRSFCAYLVNAAQLDVSHEISAWSRHAARRLVQDSKAKQLPESLGFREGTTSVHTSRTMMLGELSLLLDKVGANGKADAYVSAIVDENALGKPTQTTRQRTAKRLAELYSLDPNCTLFRLLRHFWPADQAGSAHAGIPGRRRP